MRRNNVDFALLVEQRTLADILERSWESAHPVDICFVDLEKAYAPSEGVQVTWALFPSEGTLKRKIGWRIGARGPVL